MSERDKRRSNSEEATPQRRIVIASQETRSHDENSRKKENRESTKEIYQTDSSRNYKRVNSSKRFNHVSLKA